MRHLPPAATGAAAAALFFARRIVPGSLRAVISASYMAHILATSAIHATDRRDRRQVRRMFRHTTPNSRAPAASLVNAEPARFIWPASPSGPFFVRSVKNPAGANANRRGIVGDDFFSAIPCVHT